MSLVVVVPVPVDPVPVVPVVPVEVLEAVVVAEVAEGSQVPPRSRQAGRQSPRLTRSVLSRADTR